MQVYLLLFPTMSSKLNRLSYTFKLTFSGNIGCNDNLTISRGLYWYRSKTGYGINRNVLGSLEYHQIYPQTA